MAVSNHSVSLRSLRLPANASWKNNQATWVVVWIREGEASFDPLFQLSPLVTGTALVVPKGCELGFKAHPASGVVGHTLYFDPATLPCAVPIGTKVLLEHTEGDKRRPRLLPRGNPLIPLLDSLAAHLHAPRPSSGVSSDGLIHVCPCPLVTHLNPVIEVIIRMVSGSTHSTGGDIGQRVTAILGSLGDGEWQDMTIDELARRCGCSRRHLSRLMREQCGISVSELVNRVRIEKAAELLRDQSRKIFDVAMDCGFNHLGAFSIRFRERFGATPAVWRRQQLTNGNGNGNGNGKSTSVKKHGRDAHGDLEGEARAKTKALGASHQNGNGNGIKNPKSPKPSSPLWRRVAKSKSAA